MTAPPRALWTVAPFERAVEVLAGTPNEYVPPNPARGRPRHDEAPTTAGITPNLIAEIERLRSLLVKAGVAHG